MRWRASTLAVAAVTSVLALAGFPSPSKGSTLGSAPCAESPAFTCSSLAVPLERSGTAPGTISLSVARKLASATPSRSAVVALAGGPGQAALPLSEFIAQAIAPALGSRDLLVFDQRGTGTSDPLGCRAFEVPSGMPASQLFEACASELGPARGGFTSEESVQDIEALRQAGGYEKLVLYGTSYGTKVALEYAERYPQNVEALVLDSVVPTDGPEPFAIPTFQAIGGVLGELCSAGACAGISSNPLHDVAVLTARLSKKALSGSVYDGAGKRHASTLNEVGLLDILLAGDLNPALRALLPAAVRSALSGNPDPLLRLQALAEGLIPSVPRERGGEGEPEVDEALYVATTCEESPFPWQRSAPASTRLGEASAYLFSQPASAFYPFNAATAFGSSLAPDCASWPDASQPPAPASPLPNVPTLILSGEQDLRTPTSGALRVAAQIPDAQLLVVPFTGHSVIGSDLSDCASLAVSAFFAGNAVQPCQPASDEFTPTPITPPKLALVHPPRALGGRPGRTLVAVLDTLVDLNRQVIAATLQANQQLPSGSSFGGLHGGFARLTNSTAVLRNFSLVPGVALSATFPVRRGALQASDIRISGAQAAHGVIRFGSGFKSVPGTLGGKHFDVSLARVKLSRVGGGWPALSAVGRLLRRSAEGAGLAGARQGGARGPLTWLP
jgi:pimeloyl-ACP methyl ester carboxylesterase